MCDTLPHHAPRYLGSLERDLLFPATSQKRPNKCTLPHHALRYLGSLQQRYRIKSCLRLCQHPLHIRKCQKRPNKCKYKQTVYRDHIN